MKLSDLRSLTLSTVLLAALPLLVSAQQSPFGSPDSAEDPFADPFATSAETQAAPSPFGNAPAPQNNQAPASPFGNPEAAQPPAPASPFGNPNEQPVSQTNVQDPFSSPQTPNTNQTPASPFGDPQQPEASDPFSAPATTGNAAPASPFGNPDAAPAGNDPFAGGANSGGDIASPFGNAAAPNTPESPFGAPSTPSTGETGSFNPFETGASTSGGTISSPFGDSAQTTTVSSPFDAGGTSPSPFTTQPSATGDVNRQGINQLYAFRYEVVTRWDRSQVVTRTRLSSEEAREFDEASIQRYVDQIQANELLGYDPTHPAQLWAEWVHYSDQLELWGYYVDKIVLAGNFPDDTTYENITWPAEPQEQEENGNGLAGPQTGTEGVVNYASNTSLDDQLNDLVNPFAGAGGQGQGGQSLFGPDTIESQVVQVYNVQYQQLRQLEQDQEQAYTEFIDRLAERKSRRLAYADWRNDQERQIEDAVIDWNRRYNGSVANIGGVRYELYRPGQVPENVQRDSVVVVTDFDLTPYDILNPEDGTLK